MSQRTPPWRTVILLTPLLLVIPLLFNPSKILSMSLVGESVLHEMAPGWEVYEDERYGFKIEYPFGWYVNPPPPFAKGSVVTLASDSLLNQGNDDMSKLPPYWTKVEIGVFAVDRKPEITLYEFVSELLTDSFEYVNLNGLQVIRTTWSERVLWGESVYIARGVKVYHLHIYTNNQNYKPLWEHMLKTFTFTTYDDVPQMASSKANLYAEAEQRLEQQPLNIEELRLPFVGRYTITQGPHEDQALDYGLPENTPVFSAFDGYVVQVGFIDKGWGNFVRIAHDNGYESAYAHLAGYTVDIGQRVRKGQLIGYSGSTGKSTGSHLHFGVCRNDNPDDNTCVPNSLHYANIDITALFETDLSKRIAIGPGIALFEHRNLAGRGQAFDTDVANLEGSWVGNDTVSSIRIAPYWSAILYKHANYDASAYFPIDGFTEQRYNEVTDLANKSFSDGSPANDQISSLRIGYGVCLSPSGSRSDALALGSGCIYQTPTPGVTSTPYPPTPTPPPNPPGAPTLLSPSNGASLPEGTDIILRWTGSGEQYYAELWGSHNININSGWINGTSWHIGVIWPGSYQWRVKSRRSEVESPWSSTWSFGVGVPVPTPTSPSQPSGDWRVTYYNNPNLEGGECHTDAFSGTYVFKDWADDSPGGWCSNDFSTRITGRVHFQGGHYTFYLFADDNARLKIVGLPGGDLVVDQWWPSTIHIQGRDVPTGDYDVVVEFGDNAGRAVVEAWWTGPGFPPIPEEERDPYQWYGVYWANKHQWEHPIFMRNEGSDEFLIRNWHNDGPGYGLPADRFSTRYTRDIYFECGRYRFDVIADDGVRIWLDPQVNRTPFIDEWHSAGQYQRTIDISEGYHEIQVDYYEEGGGARIEVRWIPVSRCPTPTPTNTPTLTPTPTPPPTPTPVNHPPNTPSLVSPANGSTHLSMPQLCWQNNGDPDGDSVTFWVDVWTPGYVRGEQSGWISQTCWRPQSLSGPDTYYWHVRAKDSHGAMSEYSQDRVFSIVLPTPTPVPPTDTPVPTPTFTPVPSPTFTPPPTVAPSPTPTPKPSFYIWKQEAEDATRAGSMTIVNGVLASACRYAYSPIGWSDAAVSFSFNISTSANYYIWARVKGLSWNQNSFFVSLDNGAEFHYEIPQFNNQWDWGWDRVNSEGQPERPFFLTRGSHTLTFRAREAHARLDTVLLTNDPTYNPNHDLNSIVPCQYTPEPISGVITSYNVSTPPRLDGDLTDWSPVGEIVLNRGNAEHVEGNPSSLADLSASIRSRWDSSYLYFAVRVYDDILIMSESDDIWGDDGVELAFDGAYDRYPWGPDDHQYTLNADGRIADRGVVGAAKGVIAVTREVLGGYVVEAAIPFSELISGAPLAGLQMGFTVGLNDDDDGGRKDSWLVWAGTNTYSGAQGFGRLVLADRYNTPMPTSTPVRPAPPSINKVFLPSVRRNMALPLGLATLSLTLLTRLARSTKTSKSKPMSNGRAGIGKIS